MQLVVLPGDGIGTEISTATLEVLERIDRHFGLRLSFDVRQVGFRALEAEGTTAPASVLAACREADGVILGPVSHLEYPSVAEGGVNVSARLRIDLDLYANVRPSRSRTGLPHYGRKAMDLVIVRENTEGFYADRNMHAGSGELMPNADLALAVRKVSAAASRRIARAAFELAARRRRRVTAVHKANVLRVSDALFLREVRRVAAEYSDFDYQEQLVDSAAALLVRDAECFDVIVTTNMFGDILSDEAAELAGSLGLAGAVNQGDAHCVAQAQHGSAPDIAGQDKANPCSLILSAAMLLEWFAGTQAGHGHFTAAAAALERAVDTLLADPGRRTADVGGALGTRAFTAALCREIDRQAQQGSASPAEP